MGTAVTGRRYRITTPIEPGDTQVDVVIFVPSECRGAPLARVELQREGEAPCAADVAVVELGAAA